MTNKVPSGWEKFSKEEQKAIREKGNETLRERYKNGELKSSFKGRKHSKESIEKIRLARIEYLKHNKSNTAWSNKAKSLLSHGEEFLHKLFIENHLYDRYDIINEYCEYPYFIDFAFINEKIAVEFDGQVHFRKGNKRIEHDIKRDMVLNSKGWKIYRIPFFDINKFNINDLIEFIGNPSNEKTMASNLIKYSDYNSKLKKDKKLKITLKKQANINSQINLIKNSNINFNKLGWVNKVSEILEITPQNVNRWMKRNMLDFYNNCYKRK